METKDIIYDLRTKSGLSQDELAKKSICDATSCFSLGDGRNNAKYPNTKIIIQTI